MSAPVEVSVPSAAPKPKPAILQFFRFDHLPQHLQDISAPYSEQAFRLFTTLPDNEERAFALRKLLESKDAAVRAMVAQ